MIADDSGRGLVAVFYFLVKRGRTLPDIIRGTVQVRERMRANVWSSVAVTSSYMHFCLSSQLFLVGLVGREGPSQEVTAYFYVVVCELSDLWIILAVPDCSSWIRSSPPHHPYPAIHLPQ
jgi:hypothetical protein